jgi:transcriptional regulator with XRE-family HTH domain
MTELSPSLAARARKIESVVLQRLAERKQVKVAGEAGCSESTVSRFASDRLPEVAKILAALNLCVVSEDAQVIEHDQKMALMCLARDYLDSELARDEIVRKRDL